MISTSFFLTSIKEVNSQDRNFDFIYQNRFERWGDRCCKELRYWLNGQEFIYNGTEFIKKPNEIYRTTLQKVESLIKAIILSLPGCLLKSISYCNYSTKGRYRLLKSYQESEKSIIKIESPQSQYLMCKPIQYDFPLNVNNFNTIPNLIIERVFLDLDFQSLHFFAQICLRYYQLAKKELVRRKKEYEFNQYAPFSGLLKNNFSQIPFIAAKGYLLHLLTIQNINPLAIGNLDFKASNPIPFYKGKSKFREYPEMGKRAICRIKDKDRIWLIFRVVIKNLDSKSESLIPFLNINKRWYCVGNTLPGYLAVIFMTFNKKNYENSRILHILNRILNKKPVGLFPDNLNDLLHLTPSSLLEQAIEGPTIYPDGTPMIELWSDENYKKIY